jgi:hypothetical protein
MKTIALFLTSFVVGITGLHSAEPTKPLVKITAKPHKVDSDSDLRGKHGKSRQKTMTLRVEIVNTGSAELPASELTGDALILRAREVRERLVKESLGAVKVPAMKPNEKITLDLGKIELDEIESRNRKFEETLEEWQVSCSQGGKEMGKAVSSERYAALLKDLEPADGGMNRKKRRARAN